MAALRHPRPYSALDLPQPRRVVAAFFLLVAAALALEADPQLPWLVGVVAAGLFGTAGIVRTLQSHHELILVRRTADRLIVHAPTSREASELVRWRSAELTTRVQRDRLAREVHRVVRSLDPGRLPSASPLRRPEARRSRDLFEQLEHRLADEQPVAARGMLMAQTLLRDPASPLYAEARDQDLPRLVRRALGALEA
jgi:hypothetical protein